jgi:hypothetical protein
MGAMQTSDHNLRIQTIGTMAIQTAATEDDAIRPFHINIPEEQIVELRKRIAATRWPDKETVI